MTFWIAVIIGISIAALAVKIGFFEIFTHFCNSLIAIYIALFLTPSLLQLAPDAAQIPGGVVITVAVVAAIVFALLFALSFFLLTSQFTVPFPKIFDVVCAGGLGFLLGFLVASFALSLCIGSSLPLLDQSSENIATSTHTRYLSWWCDRLHRFVGTHESTQPTVDAMTHIHTLRTESQQRPPSPTDGPSDPNNSPPRT